MRAWSEIRRDKRAWRANGGGLSDILGRVAGVVTEKATGEAGR